MYEDACERCRNRLEDCECEPGFPAAFDPDLFYSPEARADAKRRTIKKIKDAARAELWKSEQDTTTTC